MHLKLPKPLHGWRAFVGEVGVIVLGVVIALSAEEWVQSLDWQSKADNAFEAMRTELAEDDGPQAWVRIKIDPCINRSLDKVQRAIEARADRKTVVAAIDQYQSPFFTWDRLAFDAATSSGVTARLTGAELNKWMVAYSPITALDEANRKEYSDASELKALGRVGGGLSEDERRQVLRAVEILRRDNRTIMKGVEVLSMAMRKLNVPIGPGTPERGLEQATRQWFPACIP